MADIPGPSNLVLQDENSNKENVDSNFEPENEEVEARFPAQGESFGRTTVWDPVLRRLFGFALHLFSSKFVLHHVNLGYFGTDRRKSEASTTFGDDCTLPEQHFTEKSSDGLCFTAKRDTPLCSRTLNCICKRFSIHAHIW